MLIGNGNVTAKFIQDTTVGNIFYAAGFTRSSSSLTSPDIYDQNGHGLVLGGVSTEGTLVVKAGGNVGIGVADPDVELEVDGNIKVSAGRFYQMAGSDYQIGTDGTPSRIQFHAGGSEAMFITGNGNVSIGTDIAPQKLNVKGTIVHLNNSNIQVAGITNSSEAGRLYANNAGGVSKVLLDSNGDSYLNGGDVGIGTSYSR